MGMWQGVVSKRAFESEANFLAASFAKCHSEGRCAAIWVVFFSGPAKMVVVLLVSLKTTNFSTRQARIQRTVLWMDRIRFAPL